MALCSVCAHAQDSITAVSFVATSATTAVFTATGVGTDSLYCVYDIAPDSTFTGLVLTPADSAIYTGTFTRTVTMTSAPVSWLRVRYRTSPTGAFDTSNVVKLVRMPVISSVSIIPGLYELYAAITVNSGNVDTTLDLTIWLDAAHTSPWHYRTVHIVGNGSLVTIHDTTAAVLAAATEYWPEYTISNVVGTATFDTAVYTNAVPTVPSIDTVAATDIGDTSITSHLVINTKGLSGTGVAKLVDSFGTTMATQTFTLAATTADQDKNITWNGLHNSRRYGVEYEATNPIGSAWLGLEQYVTLSTPGGLGLTVAATYSSYSNQIIITTNYSIPAASGYLDYTVFVAKASTSDTLALPVHEEGTGTTCSGSEMDSYEVPVSDTPTTYTVWAVGADFMGNEIFTPLLTLYLSPTAVVDPITVKEDIEVMFYDIVGHKMCEPYIVKPGEPICKKQDWIHGVYVAVERGMTTGQITKEKFAY